MEPYSLVGKAEKLKFSVGVRDTKYSSQYLSGFSPDSGLDQLWWGSGTIHGVRD